VLLVAGLAACGVAGGGGSNGSSQVFQNVSGGLGSSDATPAPSPCSSPPANPNVAGVAKVGPDDFNASGTVQALPGCLEYVDLAVGSGPLAQAGANVTVQYTGWLTDGTKFDSSRDRGTPFSFALGAGKVIQGWDQGVVGMKVGGRRKLIIPSDLGYGDSGFGGVIPPKATLVFIVEVVSVG
jgi:FKBP-type peptidyl-prolyl cis-trans isomerase